MRLIRNHSKAIIGDMGRADLNNMVGHNYRLGEIEDVIGIEQLKKLKVFVSRMQEIAAKLTEGFTGFSNLCTPFIPNN